MPYAIPAKELAEFQKLLLGSKGHLHATWSNDGVPLGKNGKPLSYNIMPLPQTEPQPGHQCCSGYILNNFSFTEKLRFSGSGIPKDPYFDPNAVATVAGAPNRGGRYSQIAHAIFYDQQVKFAEGPKSGHVVHVENGSWLALDSKPQPLGPYGGIPAPPGPVVPQPPAITVAKMIAVPHGNAVLALGAAGRAEKHAPSIPDSDSTYPSPLDGGDPPSWDIPAVPYYTKLDQAVDYENPDPGLALNPNRVLQEAVARIKANAFITWRVTTKPIDTGTEPVKGHVTNIPFEQRRAKVVDYTARYWLLSNNGGKTFDYLSYYQAMDLKISLRGTAYVFPHVTANTVKRQ